MFWVIGIMFTFFFLGLSYFNRFATDDYFFIYAARELGILDCVKQCYMNFSGRWLAYALTTALMNFYDLPYFLFCFNSMLFILFLLVFLKLIKQLFQQLSIELESSKLVQFALLFFAGVFFTCFDKAESWFWYTSVCSYLISLLAFLFCIQLIFSESINAIHFVLLFILTAYIGGASESFAFSFLFLLSLAILLTYSKQHQLINLLKKSTRNKLLFSSIVLLLSFAITAIAPGNYERVSLLPKPEPLAQMFQPVKSMAHLMAYSIIPNLHHFFLFTIPWYFIGLNYREKEQTSFKLSISKLLLLFILVMFFCLIFMLPGILILHETPPGRALSLVSFFLYLILSLSFFLLGRKLVFKPKGLNLIAKIYGCFMIVYLPFYMGNQLLVASNYAEAVDQRMIEISKGREKGKDIVLSALPASGFIYSAELSQEADFHSNQHLQHALKLDSPVRRE